MLTLENPRPEEEKKTPGRVDKRGGRELLPVSQKSSETIFLYGWQNKTFLPAIFPYKTSPDPNLLVISTKLRTCFLGSKFIYHGKAMGRILLLNVLII